MKNGSPLAVVVTEQLPLLAQNWPRSLFSHKFLAWQFLPMKPARQNSAVFFIFLK